MRNKILILILATLLAACSDNDESRKISEQRTTKNNPIFVTDTSSPAAVQQKEEDYELLFFLNPQGGPCKMQKAILDGLSQELAGKVTIRYIATSTPDDRPLFSQYGIRALPSLLLADNSGREIKRMPPGVQSPDAIRELLQSLP